MAVSTFPMTVKRKNAAITVDVPIHSSEPGTLDLTYPAGVTGPGTLVVAGTRTYELGGVGGDYLAYPGVGQSREGVTWLFTIDWRRIAPSLSNVTNLFAVVPLFGSGRADVQNRLNWQFAARKYPGATNRVYSCLYGDSIDGNTNPVVAAYINVSSATPLGQTRVAFTKATGGAWALHWLTRGPAVTGTRNSTGTMGGEEVLYVCGTLVNAAKLLRIATNDELDAWFAAGTVPATNREFAFLGGHEIVETSPKIYDSSGNNYDLYAYQLSQYQAPGYRTVSIDDPDNPVVSTVTLPITIGPDAASPVVIGISRARTGVPSRAPAAERLETATASITVVTEAESITIGPDLTLTPASYPVTRYMQVCSTYDGSAVVTSNDPNVVPVSPITIANGTALAQLTVTGDCTGAVITVTGPGGGTDTATVTSARTGSADWIAVGAPQRTRIEGRRIVWPLRVRSSRDGEFTAVASPPSGIILAGPFVISAGVCDFTAQPTQAGTWVVTVTQGDRSDSVTVEAIAAVPAPTPNAYDLTSRIDDFFAFVSKKYGYRPRFTPTTLQDVRQPHSTQRSYARYSQGTQQAASVFGAVSLSYKVIISYTSTTDAENDLGILREEADRYDWGCIGFAMTIQTMFEAGEMDPRLVLDLNYDIIPQRR